MNNATKDIMTKLEAAFDVKDLIIEEQRKRIIDLVKEIQDAQQERTALLEAHKAHQEDNGRLQEANDRLLRTAVDLRATVATLSKGLEAATRLLYT